MWGERDNPQLIQLFIYKNLRKSTYALYDQKIDRKYSDEHRSIPLPVKTQPNSDNKCMPMPGKTQQK